MSIIITLLILGLIMYTIYSGSKRGMVLIGLELASFALATGAALGGYRVLGTAIKNFAHVSSALGNIAGFVVIWVITEVICALIIRVWVLPHLHRQLQLSLPNRIGGGLLNGLKTAAVLALVLDIFTNLPVSSTVRDAVTGGVASQALLYASGGLRGQLAAGIGGDIVTSLNFFTVTADPESEQRVDLGFTATNVTVDPNDEAAMLVLINHERTSRGLSALTLNVKARGVARTYATDLFARGYFSHLSLEGKSPFDRMRAANVQFGSAGENLALAPTLQLAHDGLMKSPGHRANILSTSYRTVGIGIIDGGPHGLMVAQDFTD